MSTFMYISIFLVFQGSAKNQDQITWCKGLKCQHEHTPKHNVNKMSLVDRKLPRTKKVKIPSVQQRLDPFLHLPHGAKASLDSSRADAIHGSAAVLVQLCIQRFGQLQSSLASVFFTSEYHDFQRCFIDTLRQCQKLVSS